MLATSGPTLLMASPFSRAASLHLQRHTMRLTLLLSMILVSADATADIRRIWALHDGDKIERDAVNHPASRRNSVWDGKTVHLLGARNEIVAFQVIVEAGARGVRELSLDFPGLTSANDRITYRAPGPDPSD